MHGTWNASGVTTGTIIFAGKRDSVTVDLTTTTASNTTLTTSGSYTTSGINPGDLISGTGIVEGTYVVSVDSATSLTMSVAATDATANTRSFTRLKPNVKAAITAKVISSTSSTTMTAAKLQSINGTIVLTCVQDDTGYWSVWTH